MRPRATPCLLFLMLLFLLTGCYSPRVSQDYNLAQDFSRLRTYRWKADTPPPSRDVRVNSPLMAERFRQAIDGTLSRRGYLQAAGSDMVVSYEYTVQTKIESDPYFGPSIGVGYGRYYNRGFVGVGTDFGGNVRQYDVGLLVIDIADGRTGAPLWRGTATEMVRTHWTPEDINAFVYRLVDAVLAQFPPK